jgi:hypothetical protein
MRYATLVLGAALVLTLGPALADGPPGPPSGPPSGPPPGPPPGELCVVDPADYGRAPLLNVRADPAGWPIGVLPNGAQIILTGEAAGPWARLGDPFPGAWVFRPLLACQPLPPSSPPIAYAPPPPNVYVPWPIFGPPPWAWRRW